MVAKLIINGKTFDIEILDPKLQELIAPKKQTGYEIVELNKIYYYDNGCDTVSSKVKEKVNEDIVLLNNGNCYSVFSVAKQNVRADKLMRQLRRFSVENRENELDWSDDDQAKYKITYLHESNKLYPEDVYNIHDFGSIYFDSAETACKAIDTFHDELIWYFTEYKDSLR